MTAAYTPEPAPGLDVFDVVIRVETTYTVRVTATDPRGAQDTVIARFSDMSEGQRAEHEDSTREDVAVFLAPPTVEKGTGLAVVR